MDAPNSPRATLREQLLAIARQLQPFAEVDPSLPLTVVFRCGGATLEIQIDPAKIGAAHTDLSAIEQAVLRAATKTPCTVKTLARLAGYSVGRVGEAVTKLTSLDPPLLIRVAKGVRLP